MAKFIKRSKSNIDFLLESYGFSYGADNTVNTSKTPGYKPGSEVNNITVSTHEYSNISTQNRQSTQTVAIRSSGITERQPINNNHANPCENNKINSNPLNGFQREIYNSTIFNNIDNHNRISIITFAPAAGKTNPMLCAWMTNFSNFIIMSLNKELEYLRTILTDRVFNVNVGIVNRPTITDVTNNINNVKTNIINSIRTGNNNNDDISRTYNSSIATALASYPIPPNNIIPPYILYYVSPIKQLTTGFLLNDILDILIKYFLYDVNLNNKINEILTIFNLFNDSNIKFILGNILHHHGNDLESKLPLTIFFFKFLSFGGHKRQFEDLIINDFISQQIESKKPVVSKIFGIKPIIGGTRNIMASLLESESKIFPRISNLIIDEIQEFLPRPPTSPNNDSSKQLQDDDKFKYESFFRILKIAKEKKNNCVISLASGTLGKETIKWFINDILKPNMPGFKIGEIGGYTTNQMLFDNPPPPITEWKRNRSNITVLPSTNIDSFEGIIEIVKDILHARKPFNVFVIFSVKEVARMGIFRIINKLYTDRSIPIIPDSFLLTDTDKLDSPHDYVDVNKHNISRDPVNRTNSLDPANEDPSSDTNENMKINDLEYLKRLDYDGLISGEKKGINAILPKPNPNSIFYLAVKMGIGIIIGKIPTRAKRIYENLFKDKKIFIIFGTDSLGVGVNLKVENLYVPSLSKFSGDSFGPLDFSTARQLFERAGRDFKNIPNAFIHVHPTYVDMVKNLVDEDPRDIVPTVSNREEYSKLANKTLK